LNFDKRPFFSFEVTLLHNDFVVILISRH